MRHGSSSFVERGIDSIGCSDVVRLLGCMPLTCYVFRHEDDYCPSDATTQLQQGHKSLIHGKLEALLLTDSSLSKSVETTKVVILKGTF